MNKVHSKALVAIATGALLGGVASNAWADSVTDQFDVRIKIEKSCAIDSGQTTDMDFGTRQLLNGNFDTTSAIAVTCTTGVPYTIGLNEGANPASLGVTTSRRMANGGSYVLYDLYQDVAGGAHWGNNIGSDTKASTGTGDLQTHTVYGRVASQTTPPVGDYVDTITVDVQY